MQILLFLSLGVALLTVVFAFQNNAPTIVHFFAWSFEGSLALVILVAVAAGALACFLAMLPAHLRLQWNLRSSRRRVAELESPAKGARVPGSEETGKSGR